ncbi:MAG: PEP-CTERM sorting domain-containing protein [Phycisphaeraceae bacterium]|nr:PEP-CTERM sorting domain-containing protein [Phycisphaeraceae bacterium]
MFKTTLAAVTVALVTSYASAAVTISAVLNNAGVTVAGYDHYDVTATSDIIGQLVGGFDITFTAAAMRQVNPAGNPSIFQDANGFFGFVGEAVPNDSQFKYLSSEVTAPAGVAFESGTQLRAAFVFPAGSPKPGQSITFAQLVVPTGTNSITYAGGVSIAAAGGLTYAVEGDLLVIPEPASVALLSLGALAVLRRKH